jgi:hypothetical protein
MDPVPIYGKSQHPSLWILDTHLPGDLDTVDQQMGDLQDEHIRLQLPQHLHGESPVVGLAHDLNPFLSLQDPSQSLSDQAVTVSQQDPDFGRRSHV